MSISLRSSLDTLKKQALNSVLNNVTINFPYIKKDILSYTKSGSIDFTTILKLYNFRGEVISSSQVSAIYLLSYLDFYSLYILIYSNYGIFNNLKSAALNKYLHVYSLYRNMLSLISEKTSLKENSRSIYINPLNSNNVDMGMSQSLSFDKNTNGVLSYKDIISLPVLNTKSIKPKSIIISDNDKSVHETINDSNIGNIDYVISRQQHSKIGICDYVLPSKQSISYGLIPEVKGTIRGYISNNIYIIISKIEYNEDGTIDCIYIKSSTNNLQWSEPYKIYTDVESNILIEDNIETGLTLILKDGYGLSVDDSWSLFIKSIKIDDPVMTAKINFSLMEQVSYIKYMDLSKNSLNVLYYKIKDTKYGNFTYCDMPYIDELNSIIPIQSKVDELEIKAKQREPYASNNNGKLSYNYDFRLYDIEAVINEYAASGTIAFNVIPVENINKVSIDLNYILRNDGVYVDNIISQKMFIENNIILFNNNDIIEIPILMSKAPSGVIEYVVPESVDSSNTAIIKTRFPVDITKPIRILDVYNNTYINVSLDDVHQIERDLYYINLDNYEGNNSYIIEYSINQYEFKDIINNNISSEIWTIKNNIAYAYYKDLNNNNCLYVGYIENELLTPFTGNCYYTIGLKSIDLPYISPIIYECNIKFD